MTPADFTLFVIDGTHAILAPRPGLGLTGRIADDMREAFARWQDEGGALIVSSINVVNRPSIDIVPALPDVDRNRHQVPDPPTQNGCTVCEDIRHGLLVGERVVVLAPQTARMHGKIAGFAIDKADVVVDGRDYPLTVHTKWLVPELQYVGGIE